MIIVSTKFNDWEDDDIVFEDEEFDFDIEDVVDEDGLLPLFIRDRFIETHYFPV